MTSQTAKASSSAGGLAFSNRWWVTLLSFLLLLVGNAFGLILVYTFIFREQIGLAVVIGIITLLPNIVFFIPRLYPIRWMVPGFMFVTLMVIYPVIYTVETAFTNYGDYLGESHLFTKSQAAELIERQDALYVPEGAITYNFTIYQNADGELALWLTGEDSEGNVQTVFAQVDQTPEFIEDPPEEAPEVYNGFGQLPLAQSVTTAQTIIDQGIIFGQDEDIFTVLNRRRAAAPAQRYEYDPESDTIVDNLTGIVYTANDEVGYFVPPGWDAERNDEGELRPGYRVGVGLFNFTRLLEEERLRGPLIDIFVWTVVFSLLSVFTTFAMGLFMAIILEDPRIPARKVIRSLLIIPYAVPGVISIIIWRGMLNENLGIIARGLANNLGLDIPFFTDPWWAKFTILLVNLWLGYPYMMLICSGALQAIPSDIYEAAAVDGAKAWHRFWRITLPLLLVTVGPLLIASFVFNFNNYLLIEILTLGDPVFPGSPVPAGMTDILITYTYGLAFGDQGRDYGYASAITIVIFAIVALVTLFQYRFTKTWEEVGENV